MKIVFYSTSSQFTLNDKEFETFMSKIVNDDLVYIPRLKVYLTKKFIWAGERPEENNKRKLSDGTIAIKSFGRWIDENSGAKLDLNYYSELLERPEEEIKKLK